MLLAQQVAELIEQARSPERILARMGQVSLRLAVKNGSISTELLATIPPELLTPPTGAGPEVLAAGSEA
jgi:hypothetical protein